MSKRWEPPLTLEERLKLWFLPGALYAAILSNKNRRKGEAEIRLLPHLVDRRRNAVDIGANKGVYSHELARLCPRVFAFEPNPKVRRFLLKTAASNVVVSSAAVADSAGEAVLRIPRRDTGHSNQRGTLNTWEAFEAFDEVTVEKKRLDDCDLGDVGFIKIDVEGFELKVLEGAGETLARCRPVLLVELEEIHLQCAIEEAISTVEGYGYRGFTYGPEGLRSVTLMDPELEHRNPADRARYKFNFVFFPA